MMRLSKLTDYAVVVLTTIARDEAGRNGPPQALHTATSLAERTGLPAPTVQKLLKALARDRVVTSQRGAGGGYTLARPADRISVAEIIQAIDGPIALTDCVDGHEGSCGVERLCPMRGNWDRVNQAVRKALTEVTLAEMALPLFPVPDAIPAALSGKPFAADAL